MKIPSMPVIVAIAFLLGSCSSAGSPSTALAANFINRQTIEPVTKEKYPPKSPQLVTLYTADQTPHTAYRVIGIATVSKYNLLGLQRQAIVIHNMMKNLAASIGGDGLINVSSNDKNFQAKVIAFQRILI